MKHTMQIWPESLKPGDPMREGTIKAKVYSASGDEHFPQPIYGDVTELETVVLIANARSGWAGGIDAWGSPGAIIPKKRPGDSQEVWVTRIIPEDST